MQAVDTGTGWPLVAAPPSWQQVDFISDLHLQAGEAATFDAWQHYMRHTAAQAVFILGDLFEVWVGDDVLGAAPAEPSGGNTFEHRCAQTLLQAARRMDIFFMRGNRDFLAAHAFTRACAIELLDDPAILEFAGRRWLLSHGDALCLADTDYLRFRALVRGVAWQRDFLARPLAQRQAIARDLRTRSEEHKRSHPVTADVDAQASIAWLDAAHCGTMIHGHTHRPAEHELDASRQRIVLSDWSLDANPARAQVLRIGVGANGVPAHVQRLPLGAA